MYAYGSQVLFDRLPFKIIPPIVASNEVIKRMQNTVIDQGKPFLAVIFSCVELTQLFDDTTQASYLTLGPLRFQCFTNNHLQRLAIVQT